MGKTYVPPLRKNPLLTPSLKRRPLFVIWAAALVLGVAAGTFVAEGEWLATVTLIAPAMVVVGVGSTIFRQLENELYRSLYNRLRAGAFPLGSDPTNLAAEELERIINVPLTILVADRLFTLLKRIDQFQTEYGSVWLRSVSGGHPVECELFFSLRDVLHALQQAKLDDWIGRVIEE